MLFPDWANSLLGAVIVAAGDGNRLSSCIELICDQAVAGWRLKVVLKLLPDPVDTRLRRRAWSKPAERIGGDGHEESKPAK